VGLKGAAGSWLVTTQARPEGARSESGASSQRGLSRSCRPRPSKTNVKVTLLESKRIMPRHDNIH
jgi:hypothetical protein